MPTKAIRTGTVESRNLVSAYFDLKDVVIRAGYDWEIEWQAELDFEEATESDFLREAAWVVLSSGFRESVVRQRFGAVSHAFLDWRSAREIADSGLVCQERAISVFGNRRKIDAIAKIVWLVASEGIDFVKMRIRSRGLDYLQELPYIGPVTSYHLAKNLGLQVVKPDRHLVRMARVAGHDSPLDLCTKVAEAVGESVSVVDLVFWRYATLNRDYEIGFRDVLDGLRNDLVT